MRVQATDLMARNINKAMKARGFEGNVSLAKIPLNNYMILTGGEPCENERDYNERAGAFNTIRVVYDAGYYACPVYLSTRDLHTIFNRARAKDYDGFMDEVFRTIEI